VVGITAAFNILDHMDGLAAGVAAIASGYFFLFATLNGQVWVATLAGAFLGASVGFLVWNYNPAKIFMGDGGAMFLGFMLATLGLKLRFPEVSPATSWMIPPLILGVAVFDTSLIIVSRSRRGLMPFSSPGKDHAAHRIAEHLGQRRAVLVLWVAGAVFGGLAMLIAIASVPVACATATTVTVVAFIFIGFLERDFRRRMRL
jgi:UDP-GlcNAc:undecaprenyl-phosphate GlcNAc-1-phosphate transferase